MRIFIGSDHAGFDLKNSICEFLRREGYDVEDVGPPIYDHDDDYPDYALKVCMKVLKSKGMGILICGSGHGMDIAANKVKGIYASVCWNEESAIVAKEHDNINVLCLGGRFVRPNAAKRIVRVWLEKPFSREARHSRRLRKIKKIEKANLRGRQ